MTGKQGFMPRGSADFARWHRRGARPQQTKTGNEDPATAGRAAARPRAATQHRLQNEGHRQTIQTQTMRAPG